MTRFPGFAAPETVTAAAGLIGDLGERGKVLAGGQSLVLLLHQRLLAPDVLVYLGAIPELARIEPIGVPGAAERPVAGAPARSEPGAAPALRIGSMVTLRNLAADPTVRHAVPALAEAAGRVASPHIRTLGTVGGNLCHNLTGADLPPVLLALEAEAEIAGPAGTRHVPLRDFFRGLMETAVAPTELLTAVRVPAAAGRRSVYLKHAVRSVDPAIVGVAAVGGVREGRWAGVRLGLGGAAEVPQRLYEAEQVMEGRPADAESMAAAGRAAAGSVACIDDAHAGAAYRRRMVEVFVRRALAALGGLAG
jgi:carbon-monoxide dehydrogenase medium subunit